MAGLAVALSACSSTGTVDKDAQITQSWSVERLYAEAASHAPADAMEWLDVAQARDELAG